MRQGRRWFGPRAGVTLDEVRQVGATDIVSALHEEPIGTAWTQGAVEARREMIEATPAAQVRLRWSVVGSIPIPDAVKRTCGAAKPEIEAWIASLESVGEAGIPIVAATSCARGTGGRGARRRGVSAGQRRTAQ